MRFAHVVGLVVLAAIWGGSFAFMRVLVPALGPVATALGRALIAGIALALYVRARGEALDWKRLGRHYWLLGAINSALPFALFAFAADHLPASVSAILNSTSPLFGAVLSALWLAEPLTLARTSGLLLGLAGVAGVAGGAGGGPRSEWFLAAIVACLVAALCYALAAVYLRKLVRDAAPRSVAAATQLTAAALLVPLLALVPPPGTVTPSIAGLLVAFALSASGVAFLIYFWLIAEVGATRALTVTFLMPPFGMLFGVLLLGERMTAAMITGSVLVVAGTALVLRPSPQRVPS